LANYLAKTTSLHDLCLRDLKLGALSREAFLKFARGLCQNQSIIRLNMSKNKLSAYFKVFVDEGLRSYNLECLDLSSNSIENRAAPSLEKMIVQLRNLQELNLARNSINFHGIHALINGLKLNKRLRSLKYPISSTPLVSAINGSQQMTCS
jgi:Ran GTPase-activating protein (RanGAP) involved in mRNA processing and transport